MRDLHHHQTYVIEEYAEAYREHRLGRRDMLKRVLAVTGSVPLTATVLFALGCGDSDEEDELVATATTAAAPAATTAAGVGPGVSPTDPAIEASDISFTGPASELKGYLARPTASGTFPGIIVIHENRGLLDHYKDVARRFAKENFVALAVDLVSRVGGTSDDTTKNMTALRASPEEMLADLNAYTAHLQQQASVDESLLGVVGYCFGGGQTWELAINNPDIKAAVPYYGTVSAASMENFASSNAAFLGIYGANDARVNAQIPDVTARLQASGKTHEIEVFDGAGHAFFNETSQNYNEAAAQEAWTMTLAWFRKYLTG